MNESEQNKNANSEKETIPKNPKSWGIFYFILGITGLAISIFAVINSLDSLVPIFGTVIAGALIGALSILIIIYGYRIMKRDY